MVKINDNELIEACNSSKTMNEACEKLNLKFSTFKRNAERLGCYIPNQSGKGKSKRFVRNGFGERKKTWDILEGREPQYSAKLLKKRILSEGILEEVCSECGNGPEWNSKPLTLQLDHINGDSRDHRLENLRLLCPNCHTQTDTWGRIKT